MPPGLSLALAQPLFIFPSHAVNGDRLCHKRTAPKIVLCGYEAHENHCRSGYEYDRFHGAPDPIVAGARTHSAFHS